MGPPHRMLIRWVYPNQQMVTFKTTETTYGTARHQNQINKCVDLQNGPSRLLFLVPNHISCYPERNKMGRANYMSSDVMPVLTISQ